MPLPALHCLHALLRTKCGSAEAAQGEPCASTLRDFSVSSQQALPQNSAPQFVANEGYLQSKRKMKIKIRKKIKSKIPSQIKIYQVRPQRTLIRCRLSPALTLTLALNPIPDLHLHPALSPSLTLQGRRGSHL